MRIAVSACLLGTPCRFDGASRRDDALARALAGHEVTPVCPEVAGGLPTPRPPSEIVPTGDGLRVVNVEGEDVTEAYLRGAHAVLEEVDRAGCELCVLKAKSPACGCREVYDGTFSRKLVPGEGVAVRVLRAAGLRCVDETQALDVLCEPT